MELPTHDKVKFADNEILLLKFDKVTDWNNAIVISTGDPDRYKVQRSIRLGIAANLYMSYFEVVHLVLEMTAMGAKITKNELFPGGLKQCIEIGQKEFERLAKSDDLYAQMKARIHDEWDSLTITDKEGVEHVVINDKVKSSGITGISSPTGH